jgi:SAM-dependent methyltransferase
MKKFSRRILRTFKSIFVQTTQIYFTFVKSKVECNICHYKANRLDSDSWHLYVNCPNCGSGVRQRLLWATFEHLEYFSLNRIIKEKFVLHFAPEKTLGNLIKKYAKSYNTADFLEDGYSYDKIDSIIDISNMLNIKDESFDCVIACDVLEHVPNHITGIKEVYRILRKGGHCIFTVPQRDNLKITYEDLSIRNPIDREKAFGQFDHLRIYGDDFSSSLENCGFKVTAINETFFPNEVAIRNVLFPPIYSTKENVTNFRKIFIGVK